MLMPLTPTASGMIYVADRTVGTGSEALPPELNLVQRADNQANSFPVFYTSISSPTDKVVRFSRQIR